MGGGGEVRRSGYMRVVSSGHIDKFINRLVACSGRSTYL